MDIRPYQKDISTWKTLQLDGHCSLSKPQTENQIEVLSNSLWGHNSLPFKTNWLLDKRDANGKPEHVPAIAKILFEQYRTPLHREILGNFYVCSSQLEIFDTVIMILFQAGQLINYGKQHTSILAKNDDSTRRRRLQPWWIILEDVTAGGKRMFLKDILAALWLQPEMTIQRCKNLVSRAKVLTKNKLMEYVINKKMLHEDTRDSNVAFELTLGHDAVTRNALDPSDLDSDDPLATSSCGLQSAELIDWGMWTYKYVGKHTLCCR